MDRPDHRTPLARSLQRRLRQGPVQGRHAGLRRGAMLALAAWLGGCGGSLYVGIGDDGYDDPPQVSLVSSLNVAKPGQVLRLAAAASDDYGVQRVQFFRVDADGSANSLGNDSTPPFELDTVLPATTAAEVRYFARAVDNIGQSTDSASIEVTVQR